VVNVDIKEMLGKKCWEKVVCIVNFGIREYVEGGRIPIGLIVEIFNILMV